VISAIAHGVDEGGFALLDLFDGALERGFEIVGVFERAFGIPAHGFRQAREVRIGIVEIHTDMRARRIGAASFCQDDLMIPVVVVSPVVEHDDQHGNFIFRRDPERGGVEHQIAIRLQVDDEPAGSCVGESDAQL